MGWNDLRLRIRSLGDVSDRNEKKNSEMNVHRLAPAIHKIQPVRGNYTQQQHTAPVLSAIKTVILLEYS